MAQRVMGARPGGGRVHRGLARGGVALVAAVMVGAVAPAAQAAAPPPSRAAVAVMPATGLHMVDLGTLPGDTQSWATAINDRGEVVGWSGTPDGGTHPFLWSHGHMTDLSTEGSHFTLSAALGINDHGDVVGYDNPGGDRGHAILWRGGQAIDLGTLAADFTAEATAINNQGEIVGISQDRKAREAGFIWRNGHLTEIRSTNHDLFIPLAVNNQGRMAGNIFDTDSQAAWWQHGVTRLFVTPGGTGFGQGLAVNAHGAMAGVYDGNGLRNPFYWRGGHLQTLTGVPGEIYNIAQGINDHGDVVGYSGIEFAFSDPLIWRGCATPAGCGAPRLLPNPAGTFGQATDINNHGQIVGAAGPNGFDVHAVLWTH